MKSVPSHHNIVVGFFYLHLARPLVLHSFLLQISCYDAVLIFKNQKAVIQLYQNDVVTFAGTRNEREMRNSSDKYFYLMALLMGSVLAAIAFVVILFYGLKLFSVMLFNIPGSGYLFELFITAAPYLVLFAAYYIVHRQVRAARSTTAATIARIILVFGSSLCVAGLAFALLQFFHVRNEWVTNVNEYSKYSFAGHLLIVLLTAGVLATGDPKEKNWMERNS